MLSPTPLLFEFITAIMAFVRELPNMKGFIVYAYLYKMSLSLTHIPPSQTVEENTWSASFLTQHVHWRFRCALHL